MGGGTARGLMTIVALLTIEVNVIDSVLQTCKNCNQLSCDQIRNQTTPSHDACAQACSSDVTCQSSTYDSSITTCILYGCNTVGYSSSDEVVHRKSSDTGCPKYEVFKLSDYEGDCPASLTTINVAKKACLTSCLDTGGCTAVSYDSVNQICRQHTSCGNVLANSSFIFFRRHCEIACDTTRTFMQTCKNCEPTSYCTPYVTTSVNNETTCNDTCLADTSCVMADFVSTGSCRMYGCSRVDFRSELYGTNMPRMSCSDGCSVYALSKREDQSITCLAAPSEYGAYPVDYCLERCLDMADCVAMTYVRSTMTCLYHTSTFCDTPTTSPDVGKDAYARICTDPDRTYNQTCYNCKPSDTCTSYRQVGLYGEISCFDECVRDYGECHMAFYEPDNFRCSLYYCTDLQEQYGNHTMRLSFSPDCPDYELHFYDNAVGSCTPLSEDSGIPNYTECLQICLDKPGCRSVSYVIGNSTCFTYPCNTNYTTVAYNTMFVVRECSPWSACYRNYTQHCQHCEPTPDWHRSYAMPNSTLIDGCRVTDGDLEVNGWVSALYQRFSVPTCNYSLSIEVQVAYGKAAVRRTCVTDCPEYSLLALYNYTTPGTVLDTVADLPRYEACLQRCLDREGCRCITYDETAGVCIHFSSCDDSPKTAVTSGESKVHVIRTCNETASCERMYTQTCLNCRMGGGCGASYVAVDSSVNNVCTTKPQWNFIHTLASQYNHTYNKPPKCHYYPCGNVMQSLSSTIVYRKSCVADCPVFELESFDGYTGSGCIAMGKSGWNKIPDYGYCMDECLNLAGCTAIAFYKNFGECVYYSSCTLAASQYDGLYEKVVDPTVTFVERICTTIDTTPRTRTQTCVNCDIGPGCQYPMMSIVDQSKSYSCTGVFSCFNSDPDCQTLLFDTARSYCSVVQCLEVRRKTGGVVSRRTYSTDNCDEFELFKYSGYGGDVCMGSSPPGFVTYSRRAISPEDCMNHCLDMDGCRGATYDDYTNECFYSTCDTYTPASNRTFIKRLCASDFAVCNRTYMQQCTNCHPDPWACQMPYNSFEEFKPRNINISQVGVDPDLKLLWYDPRVSQTNYVECSHVFLGMGHTVYRPTCSNDCPKFEIFYKMRHIGDAASVITTIDGDLSLNYCVDKCLDMDRCRGVTFRNNSNTCYFHNTTTNYAVSSKTVFALRRCIDSASECVPNIIQTCINCGPGADCQDSYLEASNQSLATDCLMMKETDTESEAVWFDRRYSKCQRYQCSQVAVQTNDIVYRESCSSDCPRYELFEWRNRKSNCPIIGSDEGGVTLGYCVEKCLEMPGCRGVSYNNTVYYHRCDYHNCSDSALTEVDYTAIWVARKCITEECPKSYVQRCLNCMPDYNCQIPVASYDAATVEECNATFIDHNGVEMVHYDVTQGTCEAYNCSMVTRYSFHETLRWSCNDDCLLYEIYTLYKEQGTGPIIGSDVGSVTNEYCIDKCLKMAGCRGVSYYYKYENNAPNSTCIYHSTESHESAASTNRFTKRVCLTQPAPEKPNLETCLNCDSPCSAALPTSHVQPMYTASTCSPLSGDAMLARHETSNTCQETQCDRVSRYSPGTVVTRRSIANSTCSSYELIWTYAGLPTCSSIGEIEGIFSWWAPDTEFCISRCLDLAGCVTVRFKGYVCYFFDCLDVTDTSVVTTVRKYCRDNCTTETQQICLNCHMGDESPTTFQGNLTSNCLFSFGLPNIGALEFRNGVCNKYESREIQPHPTSRVYRRACHDDCPIYEIYTKNSTFGYCSQMAVELQIGHQYLCMERCLDTPGCRAASYIYGYCILHDCDCHGDSSSSVTFMWKYCLMDESQASNQSEIELTGELPRVYPNSSCILPPTTTSPPTTTTTIAPLILPLSNGTGNATPIYIWPCPCTNGLFVNMTEDEIVFYFYSRLHINRDDLSSTRRLLECATDERVSAVTIGYSGVFVCIGVIMAVVVMDIGTLTKAIRHLLKLCRDDKKPPETPKKAPVGKKKLFVRI